jgi:flagellar hook-associated protein 1
VQAMRGEIEARLANDAQKVNGLLEGIERTTRTLASTFDSATRQGLLDERDRYVDEMSTYLDVRTYDNGTGNFNIYTSGGAPLFVDGRKLRLQFDERFTVTADSVYNTVQANSGVGHLTIGDPIGGAVNLTNNGAIRSGSFAALFDLRDRILTETQAHLDEFAAAIATSLGDTTVSGVAATVGAATGFDVNLSNLQSGNVITLNYTETPAGTQRKVSLIVVNNPAILPLAAGATPDPNDFEFGIDFSGGIPAAIAAIGVALAGLPSGAGLAVTNPAAGVMRIVDDGAGNTTNVNGLSARRTVTALTDDTMSLPFFVDQSGLPVVYSGSLDNGPQKRGFAAAIRVNPALLADPSRLVVFDTILPGTTAAGDPARPSFLRDQLQSWETDFTPSISLTGSTSIYRGTSAQFIDRVIATQSQASSNATALQEGQEIVVATLRERVADVSGVSTDQELGDLIQIQNTYSANARIVSAVREMFDALLRI